MGRGPGAPGQTQGFSSRLCTASAPAPPSSWDPGDAHRPSSQPPTRGAWGQACLEAAHCCCAHPSPVPRSGSGVISCPWSAGV